MYYERLMQIASMTKQAGNTNWVVGGLARVGRMFGGKLDKNLTNVEKVLPRLRKAVPEGADAAKLKTAYEDARKAVEPLEKEYQESFNAVDSMHSALNAKLDKDIAAQVSFNKLHDSMSDILNGGGVANTKTLFNSVNGLTPAELEDYFNVYKRFHSLTGKAFDAAEAVHAAGEAYRPVRRLNNALAQQQKWTNQAALRGGLAVGGAGAAGTAGLGYLLSRGGSTPGQQTY